MFNRSGGSGHHCFVPVIIEKIFSFLTINILAICFFGRHLHQVQKAPHVPSLLSFIRNTDYIFSKCFPAAIEMVT